MPTILKYIEAISMISKRSNRFSDIECVRDASGDLFYFAGSRSILFKIKYQNRFHSLKCFISPNGFLKARFRALERYVADKNVEFIPHSNFYDDELMIFEKTQSFQYPVMVSEWIEGDTLRTTIDKLCRIGDSKSLTKLTNGLMNTFIELLSLELIHGDIKFDNIIINDKGAIFIIDWDGCYLNELDTYPTSEVGTPGFQHPLRTAEHYGFRVDDYSIALIVVIMTVLSENPSLYFDYVNKETILLSPIEIREGKSRIYDKLLEAWRYYPLRYKLLTFLGGDKIEMPNLQKILIRLSGNDDFDYSKEAIIDFGERYQLRRIIDKYSHLYGFINDESKVIIDTMYGDATSFDGGMAGVRINSDWFFIDAGANQISDIFSSIRDCNEGLYIVKINDKWGYFSPKERKITIPAIYYFAAPFINGIAKVSIDGENYFNIYSQDSKFF